MISKITGTLTKLLEDRALLAIDAFEYEVLIAQSSRRRLQDQVSKQVQLYTIEYLEGNATQGRLTPRLVGFTSEVEREFFEMFCSVDGVGVRKALKAMVRPVKDVAVAIAEQDAKTLETLPGIGGATADRIIAKLRRRISKFALIVAKDEPQADVDEDVVKEAFEALRALGHNDADARRLLDATLATKRKFKDVSALLQSVYDQTRS